MATGGNERRSFGVFWDIENCRVPKGGSARELVGRIRRRLYSTESDREAEFMCVCDASKENKELMKELNSAQVTIVHVDATNKNAADEKLRQRMRYFVETHKPPATVVLISGDVNFEGLLSDIQHRNQLDTILIHPDRINEGLRQCVQQRFPYTDFTSKLPSRPTTSKSTEHDCVILGLPCGRDSKALSARLHQLSENCGGKVLSVVPPRARIRFKDLELAERAGGRMNGEDVFGTKIKVEIAPTPVNIYPDQYNNGYQSPRSKSARKKLKKKRGSKSDYHSSDGSGNSPQSSPQGSPKSSPYRQRSPGHGRLAQQFSTEGSAFRGTSPQRVTIPLKSFSDLNDQFDEDETTRSEVCESPQLGAVRGGQAVSQICNGKSSPASPRQHSSGSIQEDGDSEMENLPWNQKAKSSSPHVEPRERHNSYTPTFVYKKRPQPRNRTLSDPPASFPRQRTPDKGLNNESPSRTFYRQYPFDVQPSSPFREPRGRGGRGGGPGRRFSRSRSNSSNRSNMSSPSLSDSGDRFSADTTNSDPSFRGSSPTFVAQGCRDLIPDSSPVHHRYNPPTENFHLRVTNLDNKKDQKELKCELQKYFQRHAKVEDISIECQSDGSLVGIVKVSTLKAAERAASKLHRTTKIGCKRIHVYLKHQSPTSKLKANVVELLKEIPGHCLKWFKFVDLYEKRYERRIALSDVEHLSGEVVLLNDKLMGHSVQLVRPVTQPVSTEKATSSTEWVSRQATPTSIFTPPAKTTPPPVTPAPSGVRPSSPVSEPCSAKTTNDKAVTSATEEERHLTEFCSMHCRASSPAAAEASATHCLPNVHCQRKTFAAQVHTLLQGHNGSMPLKSFMACYRAEFPLLPPGEVPLDHLIAAIPGVCITAPDSPIRHVRWAANKSQASALRLPPRLAELADEVTEVLSSVPRCTLSLSDFLPKYQALHGKSCCFSDYGHDSLHGLMAAMPHVVQIFGWGSCRQVSLTHQVQQRRFLSDVVKVLRRQPQWQMSIDQLPTAFCNLFRKPFNVSDYGACYIEDLISDLPGNVVLVQDKEGVQTLELTRLEVLLDLERHVVAALRGRDQGVALPVFLSTYHTRHGVNLSLADYNVTSVRDLLLLLPASVTIERKSGRDVIRLLRDCDLHLKLVRARQVVASYSGTVIACSDFLQRHRALYGEQLDPEELGRVLRGVAEVSSDETGPRTLNVLTVESVSQNMRNVLKQHGYCLSLEKLESAYRELYGSPTAINNAGFTSLVEFATAHPNLTVHRESDGRQCVSCTPDVSSDICGNVDSAKPTSSSELKNAARHLQSVLAHPSPVINNTRRINHAMENATPLVNKATAAIMKNTEQASAPVPEKETSDYLCSETTPTLGECVATPPSSLGMVVSHVKPAFTNPVQFSAARATVGSKSTTGRASLPASPGPRTESSPPQSADHPGLSSSRVASSRPASRTASNSSGSPLNSPHSYPGTPRRNRLAAKFTNPVITPSPPLQSDSDV